MGHADLRGVAEIEHASFGSPWRASTYGRAVTNPSHHFYVAELDGELVAYAGFWVEGSKAHIAKLAVHPDCRRRGIASMVLERLLDQARRLGLPEAYLEVRKSNQAAQELYQRFGFRFERVQPRAYPDNSEDALVLVRDDLLAVKPGAIADP
jgi:ribosomal-protein-alanine N-acetyltransferase